MRVAHITDVHVMVPPKARELLGKRALGSVNLFLLGRKKHFSERAQEALVDGVSGQNPDLVICTGDLTAQATPEEFRKAHEILSPLFESFTSVVIPGNHDTYTSRARTERRIESLFGTWTQEGTWPRSHEVGDMVVVGVDVCQSGILSTGFISTDQLQRLDTKLSSENMAEKSVIIALHYPLRDYRGELYTNPTHCLKNVAQLEGLLRQHSSRILMILHGHIHRGFRTHMPSPAGDVPIFNPGSSGYAWLPELRRTAHFNIYDVKDGEIEVERFAYNGDKNAFISESGGAYASGW